MWAGAEAGVQCGMGAGEGLRSVRELEACYHREIAVRVREFLLHVCFSRVNMCFSRQVVASFSVRKSEAF